MRVVSYDEVLEFLKEYLSQKLEAQDRELPADFSGECDLLLAGLVDSFEILEMAIALSNYCGKDIDFEAMNPDQLTIVEPLCRFVSEQTSAN